MDWDAGEICDGCGFDHRLWNVHDADSFFSALDFWWRSALQGLPEAALNRRPARGVWSVLEYGRHTAATTRLLRGGAEAVTTRNGVDLGPEPRAPADASGETADQLDPSAVLADLEREGAALAGLARRAEASTWEHRATLGASDLSGRAILLHAVHDASHHQMDVSHGLAAVGVGPDATTGTVAQLNVSGGGVPKRAVAEAVVDRRGLSGDRQESRRHHGRQFQALCLWSTEVIDRLAGEGHPIGPGSAGENVTVSGLDWTTLRPGTRIRIGTVMAEVSYPATPCVKQRRWFSDGDFSRLDHDLHPESARWYAWVRQAGHIRPGDTVILNP